MTDSLLRPMQAVAPPSARRVLLDGRRPQLLDHRGHVLQVIAGHVDLFAVVGNGQTEGARQHLLRIETGGIIPDLPEHIGPAGDRLQVIAVGGLDTEAAMMARTDCDDEALVHAWISTLAKAIVGSHPSWEIREAESEGAVELASGERRRGAARNIVWV